MSPSTAIVLSAHGTPEHLDELPAFLANIRRGRPAPPDVLAEVRRRYEAIGGRSPLMDVTRAQAEGLAARVGLPVRVAMRLWQPYPAEVLAGLAAQGVRRVLSLPLAPFSVHVYHEAIAAAAAEIPGGMAVVRAPAWNVAPGLIRAWTDSIERCLAAAGRERRTLLVLSAHSLPVRVVEAGDPYAALFTASARAVTAELGPDVAHTIAYQSQGMTGDAWLGPDLHDTLRDAKAAGFAHVVVAPIGFLTDHVEVLYDIDVEARQWAAELGLSLTRTQTLNADPALLDALAEVARAALTAA
jgi:ferrochelatase